MRQMGLTAIYRRPQTPSPDGSHRVYPYRLRHLRIERPNQVWCADVERHEALLHRAVVKGHRLQSVAAG